MFFPYTSTRWAGPLLVMNAVITPLNGLIDGQLGLTPISDVIGP